MAAVRRRRPDQRRDPQGGRRLYDHRRLTTRPEDAMTLDEIAPGIHRIESDLGVRFMAQYLLVGELRSLLIDTGIGSTPDEALIPALERLGIEPDVIAISHADLDHSGGNRRMHERYPDALLACHELDRPWI